MLRIGQVETTATSDGLYTDGSVAGGIAATRLRASAFNAMQEELAHIVEEGGDALSIDDMTQVLKALKKLFLSRSNPFGDIALDGPEAIATALSNLRLGAGAPAIGIPFFWPLAAMPNTVMDEWSDMVFLKPNGASFSATEYPKLAKVWTGLIIPDMRGEFPRIWDDGRGVDAGRALLSAQGDAVQSITGSIGRLQMLRDVSYSGPFSIQDSILSTGLTPSTSGGYGAANYNFDISRVARTAAETRSRNIALNFLVRAK
ncbi:tail fiber protein [Citrobacter farmeri]|uniref:tail fiber protein n=1 Tax=Citrobacter farmeri TaxID=67824 RepID=UPI0019051D5B|nr:tail fiber protein [Citrobacter farmeri]MBJ9163407.1 tail fiber protein [Citrobacter farmeri]